MDSLEERAIKRGLEALVVCVVCVDWWLWCAEAQSWSGVA
jgi:hypothetical protein